MTNNELFDILKSKYNTKEFEYNLSDLSIKYNGYYITIEIFYDKIIFELEHPSVGYSSVKYTIIKHDNINDRILKVFSIMIRCIKKIKYFDKQKDESLEICKPLILNFINDNYKLELNKQNQIFNRLDKSDINWFVNINLPKTITFTRKRQKQSNFNLVKEKKRKLTYYIEFKVNYKDIIYLFNFMYQSSENILKLLNETIIYKKNDISSIIRSEKLKKIMLNE